jgi:hypothetical protein
VAYPENWSAALRFSVPPRGRGSWTWRELGDHYLGLLAARAARGESVRRAAAGLAGSGPDSLAEGAFRLLQARVRYLADEERMNAYVPRPPERVLANGYGDCKEMANLMRALLAERGVSAELALAQAPGSPQLSEAYPSLSEFNHMILSLRGADGARRWFDPTVAAAGASQSYLPLLYRKALVLAAGASALDTVLPAPGYHNRAVTQSRLGPGRGGHWELRGAICLKGKSAFDLNQDLRHRYPGPSEARAAVRSFLAESFGIQAAEWEWASPSPDSARITYAMPADAMLVTLGSGGLKLDVPWLMGLGPRLRDSDPDHELRFSAFEQEDHWILPPEYRQWETRSFQQEGAEGDWISGHGEARRDFRCAGLAWKAGERERLEEFLDALSGFSLASVWQ